MSHHPSFYEATRTELMDLPPIAPTLRGTRPPPAFRAPAPKQRSASPLELLPLDDPAHHGPLSLTDAILAQMGMPFGRPASPLSLVSISSGPTRATGSDSDSDEDYVPLENPLDSPFSRPASPASPASTASSASPANSGYLFTSPRFQSFSALSALSALSLEPASESSYDADFAISPSPSGSLSGEGGMSSFENVDPVEAFSDSDTPSSPHSHAAYLSSPFSSPLSPVSSPFDSPFSSLLDDVDDVDDERETDAGSVCSDSVLLSRLDKEEQWSDDDRDDFQVGTPPALLCEREEREERELAFLRRIFSVSLIQRALPLNEDQYYAICHSGLSVREYVEDALLKRPLEQIIGGTPGPASPAAACAVLAETPGSSSRR